MLPVPVRRRFFDSELSRACRQRCPRNAAMGLTLISGRRTTGTGSGQGHHCKGLPPDGAPAIDSFS